VTEYIDPEQAGAAAQHLVLHIRDHGLLYSALARPQASAFGEDAYSTIELKAAALMTSIARNHALFDGNKRFSLYLTVAFLKLNGLRVVMPNEVAFDLILGVAEGKLDLEETARVLGTHLVPDSPDVVS
jgi:death-on-curing protein